MENNINNRLIKFRGKRVDNNEWVYGSLVVCDNGECEIIDYANHSSDTYSWNKVIPETAGQFTGLKDKAENEIYEGDILRVEMHQISAHGYWTEQISTVSFENGCFVHRSTNGFFNTLGNNVSFVLIIGNIHDKIELAPLV